MPLSCPQGHVWKRCRSPFGAEHEVQGHRTHGICRLQHSRPWQHCPLTVRSPACSPHTHARFASHSAMRHAASAVPALPLCTSHCACSPCMLSHCAVPQVGRPIRSRRPRWDPLRRRLVDDMRLRAPSRGRRTADRQDLEDRGHPRVGVVRLVPRAQRTLGCRDDQLHGVRQRGLQQPAVGVGARRLHPESLRRKGLPARRLAG